MSTLQKIREHQRIIKEREEYKKQNYKSPSGAIIISRFLKDYNIELITQHSLNNNLSKIEKEDLIEKYNKLSYYTPTLTPSKIKEAEFIENNGFKPF